MRWTGVRTDGTVNGNSDVADTAKHSKRETHINENNGKMKIS